jgi:hypothetical protein
MCCNSRKSYRGTSEKDQALFKELKQANKSHQRQHQALIQIMKSLNPNKMRPMAIAALGSPYSSSQMQQQIPQQQPPMQDERLDPTLQTVPQDMARGLDPNWCKSPYVERSPQETAQSVFHNHAALVDLLNT